MNWTILLSSVLTGLISSTVIAAWITARKDVQIKRMEQGETERGNIRKELSTLKIQLNNLYDKYLEVLKDHKILEADYDIQKKELLRLHAKINSYKNQEGKITRLTKALNKYYKDGDVKMLIETFEKELLK